MAWDMPTGARTQVLRLPYKVFLPQHAALREEKTWL